MSDCARPAPVSESRRTRHPSADDVGADRPDRTRGRVRSRRPADAVRETPSEPARGRGPYDTAALVWCLSRPALRDVALVQWSGNAGRRRRGVRRAAALGVGRGVSGAPRDALWGEGERPDPDDSRGRSRWHGMPPLGATPVAAGRPGDVRMAVVGPRTLDARRRVRRACVRDRAGARTRRRSCCRSCTPATCPTGRSAARARGARDGSAASLHAAPAAAGRDGASPGDRPGEAPTRARARQHAGQRRGSSRTLTALRIGSRSLISPLNSIVRSPPACSTVTSCTSAVSAPRWPGRRGRGGRGCRSPGRRTPARRP